MHGLGVGGEGGTLKRTSNEIKDLTTSESLIMMLAHGFPFDPLFYFQF
jgi:hypothetical protein